MLHISHVSSFVSKIKPGGDVPLITPRFQPFLIASAGILAKRGFDPSFKNELQFALLLPFLVQVLPVLVIRHASI